jgi:hypothetical protein
MPLPSDLAEFCVLLQQAPGTFCVTLPGGAKHCVSYDFDIVDPSKILKQLFADLNGMLTPLVPIFQIVDFAQSAFACIEAIPDAIGPPPDPSKLINCVPDLARKAQALIALLPQYSIPVLAKEILFNLIVFARGLRSRIEVMIRKAERIVEAETRAAQLGNVQLQTVLDCAKGTLDNQLVNLNNGLTPLNQLIGLVNFLLDLAGLPCIPEFGGIGDLTEEALAPLDELIALLQQIYDLIPAPAPDFAGPGAISKPCDS